MAGKTINEIIYNLRLELKDQHSDDLKFTDRNLEFMVNYVRAKLIRQDLQKNRSVNNTIEQSLGVVELETVDSGEDPDFITGSNQVRTIKDIPSTIDVDGKDLITYIGGLDNSNRIDLKPYTQAIKNSWTKYASKRIAAYYLNNKIYIAGCNSYELKYITISGVFENPRDVYNFKKKNGDPCYNPNKDSYPISSSMLDMVNSIIKRNELDLYYQLIEDKVNDGQSNS